MNALLVESIQDPAGSEVLDTNIEIDRWKLIGTDVNKVFKGPSDGETIIDWEKEDYPNANLPGGPQSHLLKIPIGVGITCSNGVWNFPVTGLYKIDIMLAMSCQGLEAEYGATLRVSRDGGVTYISYARLLFGGVESGDRQTHTVSASHFINVSSLDVLFKLESHGMDNEYVNIKGDRSSTRGTSVSITRIGPAV